MIQRRYFTRDRVPFTARTATPADVEGVLALQLGAMTESDEYFVRTPTEFESVRGEAADRLLELLEEKNSVWLVATVGDEIIGSLDFHGGEFARTQHVGHFGLTVHPDYRNRSVGTALIDTLLWWAAEHPVIEKVCVTLFTNNARAINLCSRHGFRSEGRRHREYQISPGRYMDALLLAKWVK